MKKMTLIAAILGLAFIVGTPAKSEAFCLFFGCDDGDVAVVIVDDGSNVDDSTMTAGNGNTTALQNTSSVIVGGNAVANQSNSIGGMGFNRGDVSQSNSANLTGMQNTDIRNNDMRSFRGTGSQNN